MMQGAVARVPLSDAVTAKRAGRMNFIVARFNLSTTERLAANAVKGEMRMRAAGFLIADK